MKRAKRAGIAGALAHSIALWAPTGCERSPTPPAATVDAEPAGRPPPAKECRLAAGDARRQVKVGNTYREYVLHVGERLEPRPAVVFTWHGFGSRPENSRASLRPAAHWADAIVVAPRGLPRKFEQLTPQALPGWQIAEGELENRDLLLFDAIVDELDELGCLDRSRIYTTGFSNGGFFSHVLACHRSEVIAAAAPTGGGGPSKSDCGRPIPMLITHGTQDEIVPYALAVNSLGHWRRHNGCDARTEPAEPRSGCEESAGCTGGSPVRMCSFDGGHQWPAGHAERVATFLREFSAPTR